MNGSVSNPSAPGIVLGLRANWQQFSLLVLINAFVGGMVGLQGTVVPLIGSQEFKIASTTAVLSFIVSFGVIKAVANLVSGHFADIYGRKHMLVLGWLIGLPVPFMIGWAPNWGWVVAANALLGINQGFAWSMTVIMKVDLVGPKSRGLAVGLNEFAGYLPSVSRLFSPAILPSTTVFVRSRSTSGSVMRCLGSFSLYYWCVTRGIMSVRRSPTIMARSVTILVSGRCFGALRTRTATCSRHRRQGWSTT